MVKEAFKSTVMLLALSVAVASMAALSSIRALVVGAAFPIMLIVTAWLMEREPRIQPSIEVSSTRIRVGDEVEVKVRVVIKGGYGLVLVRAPPMPNSPEADGFELVDGKNVHVVFKGLGDRELSFSYRLRAVRRGRYELRGIEYTYHSILGLRPPVSGLVDVGVGVEVSPRVKLITRVSGVSRPREPMPRSPPSILGPHSTEFRAVRQYVVGDPYKFINWKATARNTSGGLMVNEYEREGLRTVLFVLDSGRWMRYGTWEENPLEYGIQLILSLSRLLLKYGYNVGLWTGASRVYPSSGMDHYYRIQRAVMTIEARLIPQLSTPELHAVVSRLRPIVVVMSSITSDSVYWIGGLLRTLPTYGVLVDIIPHSIVMRRVVPGQGCFKALAVDRFRYRRLIPGRFRVVSWDPACEPMGNVVVRVLSHVGWGS